MQRREPEKYFDLVEMVGSKGKYQMYIFLIFLANWALAAIFTLGISVFFLQPRFNCTGTKAQIEDCERAICAKSPMDWTYYLNEGVMESLATEFGPYLCGRKNSLNLLRMIPFIGVFLGYLVIPTLSDNFGRRSIMIGSSIMCTSAIYLFCLAQSMEVACVALFVIGLVVESQIRVTASIFSEIVDNQKRQDYLVMSQIVFGLGGVFIGVSAWMIRDWRSMTFIIGALPSTINLILMALILQETPKYLIKRHGVEETVKALNRIAKINNPEEETPIEARHIQSVITFEQIEDHNFNFIITPVHLFTFKSLRRKILFSGLAFMLLTLLYFGPVIIMDELGLNPFTSMSLISLSEAVSVYPVFLFIEKMPRVLIGKICGLIVCVMFGIVALENPQANCGNCFAEVMKIALVFAARFTISFYFSIFIVYLSEIFPLRARVLGIGTTSLLGAIASTSGQYLFTSLQDKHFNTMTVFSAIGFLFLICCFFLQETLDKPLEDELQEILEEKQKNLFSDKISKGEDDETQNKKAIE